MNDLMVDIETLGTGPNSVILSIGAVEFDPVTGKTFDGFFIKINSKDCYKHGLQSDIDTIVWWIKQKPNLHDFGQGYNLKYSLEQFIYFIITHRADNIWANSPSFDLVILKNAFNKVDLQAPWNFRDEKDVRTVSSLFPEIKQNCEFIGERHNSIDDCKHQIRYLCQMLNKIKGIQK